jgi:hypothetical protein
MPEMNSTTGTTETNDANAWAERFTELVNEDPELNAHGTYYNCSFLWDMTERQVLVRMHRGKVESIDTDAKPLDHYQFALRASEETWRGMAQETPKPMYHGIWAASFRKDLSLEGDLLVMMQNLRCFTRQIELLRVAGVPV